jgi:hypothetical protein
MLYCERGDMLTKWVVWEWRRGSASSSAVWESSASLTYTFADNIQVPIATSFSAVAAFP